VWINYLGKKLSERKKTKDVRRLYRFRSHLEESTLDPEKNAGVLS
jgi:hypothetical protein